ncbi:hypothetical protein M0R45_030295 [Rubus argutus]|uniref:A20-type domain-containing protein n=1 Tax=Rubus argutus TaxID=59490 RepID=A0AAW1WCS8_RUBAR
MESHDGTGCQAPDRPILCINNCGFFGRAAYDEYVLSMYKLDNGRQVAVSTEPSCGSSFWQRFEEDCWSGCYCQSNPVVKAEKLDKI